jgi:hypothetical protein
MVVTEGWFEEEHDSGLPGWMFDDDGVLLRDPDDVDEDDDGLYARN